MNRRYRYKFSISEVTFSLETEICLREESAFLPFLAESDSCDFRIDFRETDQLPLIPEKSIAEELCYRVYSDGKGGYLRGFFEGYGEKKTYAVASRDLEQGLVHVAYLPEGVHCFSEFRNSFFHVGLESLLVQKDRLCIHASCVDTPLGGILFSGPSGIGKSTQAELWCRCRNAVQINGDRPILSREKNGWRAWGSPYAGSSNCHVNSCCDVSAIVFLKQKKECSLRRMPPSEAFRAIWSGLTVNTWDEGFVEKACDLAMDLAMTIPVFEYGCTPDEEAVAYLEKELRKDNSV